MPKGTPKAGKRRPRSDRGMKRGPHGMPKTTKFNKPMVMASFVRESQVFEEPKIAETDAQIDARLRERFDIMELMARATAEGENRAMIISGPPGLGKSYGVNKVMEEVIASGRTATHIQGFVRPTGLYKTLYDNRHPHCVVIFDDADSVFLDDMCLGILKVACDTTRTRRLSWLAETKMLDEDGIRVERSFEFQGSVIFITNCNFDALIQKGNKLAPHLEALISRAHYLDLTIHTKQDYLVRIKQVIKQGMLRSVGINAIDEVLVMSYIEKNADSLRELSLRMVLKIANLVRMKRDRWESIANATCKR